MSGPDTTVCPGRSVVMSGDLVVLLCAHGSDWVDPRGPPRRDVSDAFPDMDNNVGEVVARRTGNRVGRRPYHEWLESRTHAP